MPVNKVLLYQAIARRVGQLRSMDRHGTARPSKISQQDLANRIGVSRTTIANLENQRQQMPLHLLYDICIELGVEAREVLPTLGELQTLGVAPAEPRRALVGGRDLNTEVDEDLAAMLRKVLEE